MRYRLCLLLLATVSLPTAYGQGMMHRMLGTLPPRIGEPAPPPVVDLGRVLFYDPRLSASGKVSCNTCHDLSRYGVDGLSVSVGHEGKKGNRNSPSVYHAAGHVAQFWDGRAKDVEEQSLGPVTNPVEMAMGSTADLELRLQSIPGYRALFRAAYGDENITAERVARAIGAFERGLTTPSRWDRFLAGDRNALSMQEREGHHEFMHGGCASCHQGPYVGGSRFEKLGKEKAWPVTSDVGRMSVTGKENDRMVFKVPSLRNVEKTAPYFHDGSVAKLDEVVRRMARHQLGYELDAQQTDAIVAWLKTLTGEIPREYIAPPRMP